MMMMTMTMTMTMMTMTTMRCSNAEKDGRKLDNSERALELEGQPSSVIVDWSESLPQLSSGMSSLLISPFQVRDEVELLMTEAGLVSSSSVFLLSQWLVVWFQLVIIFLTGYDDDDDGCGGDYDSDDDGGYDVGDDDDDAWPFRLHFWAFYPCLLNNNNFQRRRRWWWWWW